LPAGGRRSRCRGEVETGEERLIRKALPVHDDFRLRTSAPAANGAARDLPNIVRLHAEREQAATQQVLESESSAMKHGGMADPRQLSMLDWLAPRAAPVKARSPTPASDHAVASGAQRGVQRPARPARTLRRSLNPVEEARILADMMQSQKIDVRAAGKLMGWSYVQARRLHRIHVAIPAIKQAIFHGQLHARAAIEVVRIHNAHVKALGPEEGQRRTEELLERIVRERWSIRRIERHAKQLVAAALRVPAPVSVPQGGPQAPLLVRGKGRVVIDERRLQDGAVTPEERRELVAVIEGLLWRVRRCV
jgi:hypothetical protein